MFSILLVCISNYCNLQNILRTRTSDSDFVPICNSEIYFHFSKVNKARLAAAINEIARNAIDHGGGANFHMETVSIDGKKGVRATFEDQGQGIPHLNIAMGIEFGADDERFGAAGSQLNLVQSKFLNHHCQVTSGILKTDCQSTIQTFFKTRRD